MKNKFIIKILGFHLFVGVSANNLIYADNIPPPPNGVFDGSGGGVVGPGAPASPIDMYQILLLGLALFMIIYFYKKIKLSKV